MNEEMTKFSDNLAVSIEKLYRAGGFALVFIFIGILAMLTGHFFGGPLSNWIFGIGALLNIVCLGFFLYVQLSGPIKARQAIQENKEMMDSIQEIALELTRTSSLLQSFMFKHIKQVDQILDTAVPILVKIPFVGEKLDDLGISDARNTSDLVVDFTIQAEKIIKEVERALTTGDMKDIQKLERYSNDLSKVTITLRDALRKRQNETKGETEQMNEQNIG